MGFQNAVQTFVGARRPEFILPALLVHLNIVIYAAAYWITQPVLPFLTKELGSPRLLPTPLPRPVRSS